MTLCSIPISLTNLWNEDALSWGSSPRRLVEYCRLSNSSSNGGAAIGTLTFIESPTPGTITIAVMSEYNDERRRETGTKHGGPLED